MEVAHVIAKWDDDEPRANERHSEGKDDWFYLFCFFVGLHVYGETDDKEDDQGEVIISQIREKPEIRGDFVKGIKPYYSPKRKELEQHEPEDESKTNRTYLHRTQVLKEQEEEEKL